MNPAPKLRDPILLFLLAAFFVAIALKIPGLPDWFRWLCLAVAVVFGFFGTASAVSYLTYLTAERIKDLNKARLAGTLPLAYALQGLTPAQTDIIARHDVIEIVGLLGSEGILWSVKSPRGDIPLDFMYEFLEKSIETAPYLFPIRRHDEIDYVNSEELLSKATNLFTDRRWAERSSGPYAARWAKHKSIEIVAAEFGLEI